MIHARLSTAAVLVLVLVHAVGCASQPGGQPDAPNSAATPSPPPAGTTPFVFVSYREELRAYRPDTETGALSLATRTAWSATSAASADPAGRFLWTFSEEQATAWRVQPGGSVTRTASSTSMGGAWHPSGRFGYVYRGSVGPNQCEVEGRGSVLAVRLGDGALSALADSDFRTGVAPSGLAFGAGGRFAYIANSGDQAELYGPCPFGGISGYAVDPDSGRLSSLGPAFAPSRAHRFVRADADGRLLFVGQRGEYPAPPGLVTYAVDPSSGVLTRQGQFELPRHDQFLYLFVEPRQRIAFLSSFDEGGDGQVLLRTIGVGDDGDLVQLGQEEPFGLIAPGQRPWSVLPSPDGRFAYVFQPSEARLAVLRIDPTRGLLPSDAPTLDLGPGALGVLVLTPGAQ